MLSDPECAPERAVLSDWAAGFVDRDGKFVLEFQTTYEACHWELYVHAVLKELGASIDFSYHAPDFVVSKGGDSLTIEATISAPSQGGAPAYGSGVYSIPDDFNELNQQAALRICNSFTTKVKKYRSSYGQLAHVRDKPFVLALAAFDRPHPQLAVNRPIFLSLYGEYYDEEATIESGADALIQYPLEEVEKRPGTTVPVGLFRTDEYSEVSAVVFSPVATWGKVRALADKPDGKMIFVTYRPQSNTLLPLVQKTLKRDYVEHLLDGLYVFHNPYADVPLDPHVFGHARVAQYVVDPRGGLEEIAPDDFLLLRHLFSVNEGADAMLEALDKESK
jgi:hypothetical protein